MYQGIQKGSSKKSYIRKDFLIYEEMRKYLTIYEEAVGHIWLCTRSLLKILTYEENFLFFFNSVDLLEAIVLFIATSFRFWMISIAPRDMGINIKEKNSTWSP